MFDAKLSLFLLGLAFQDRLASGPLYTSEYVPARLNGLSQMHFELFPSSSTFVATATARILVVSSTMASESPARTATQGQVTDSKAKTQQVPPPKEKPQYTCPDGKDTFSCLDCGGAKNVGEWRDGGEPNAECIGFSDGMWEGCPCYEDPDDDIFGSESEERETHVYALERDFSKIKAAGRKRKDGM